MIRALQWCVACLLTAAVLASIVRANGDSPLMQAVKAGDLQAVRALVKSGTDVNIQAGDGSTPLLWAVDSRQVEIARALIGAGATVDAPTISASRRCCTRAGPATPPWSTCCCDRVPIRLAPSRG